MSEPRFTGFVFGRQKKGSSIERKENPAEQQSAVPNNSQVDGGRKSALDVNSIG